MVLARAGFDGAGNRTGTPAAAQMPSAMPLSPAKGKSAYSAFPWPCRHAA